MKNRAARTFFLILGIVMIGGVSVVFAQVGTQVEWQTDVGTAIEIAEQEDKPIFLVITGGIWCDSCSWFWENTLSDDGLSARINDHWIPLRLSDTDPQIMRWNEEIVPAVLMLDSSGAEVARIAGNRTADVIIGRMDSTGIDGSPGTADVTRSDAVTSNDDRVIDAPDARKDDLQRAVFRLDTGTIWNDGGAIWYTEDIGLPLSFEEYDRDSFFLYLRNTETATVVAITMSQEDQRRLWRWNRDLNSWEEIGPLQRID